MNAARNQPRAFDGRENDQGPIKERDQQERADDSADDKRDGGVMR